MERGGIPEPEGWDDRLTGVGGPDAWQRELVIEVARADRYRRPLAIVLLQLGGFEELADDVSEDLAAKGLRVAAQVLLRESRTSDAVFRIGEARFGVILGETDEVAAINFVERVRERLASRLPVDDAGLRISFGWASPVAGESADVLVRRADHRMIGELLG